MSAFPFTCKITVEVEGSLDDSPFDFSQFEDDMLAAVYDIVCDYEHRWANPEKYPGWDQKVTRSFSHTNE